MALLTRFLKLSDAEDTQIFTFVGTKSVTRDLNRVITSKEFRWTHNMRIKIYLIYDFRFSNNNLYTSNAALCFLYKCILQIQFYSKVVFAFILLILILYNITLLAFKLFIFFCIVKLQNGRKYPEIRNVVFFTFHYLLRSSFQKLLKWPLNSHQAEGFRSLSNYLSAAPMFCTLQTFRTSLIEDKCSSADL